MTKKPVIEFQNVNFQYNSQAEATLIDINLTIYEGEESMYSRPFGFRKKHARSFIERACSFCL